MNTLGENIRLFREKAGMTQKELAEKTGYRDRTSIAKIESGKIDLPQSKIKIFADALGTTIEDLMGFRPMSDVLIEFAHAYGNSEYIPLDHKVVDYGRMERLYSIYSMLSKYGQKKLLDYAEDMAKLYPNEEGNQTKK